MGGGIVDGYWGYCAWPWMTSVKINDWMLRMNMKG